MKRQRPPSKSTLLVLSLLTAGPEYGYSIIKSTGLKSGTLYPILMRLKEKGYISSDWQASESPGRPPRQIYQITPKGRAFAADTLKPSLPSQGQAKATI